MPPYGGRPSRHRGVRLGMRLVLGCPAVRPLGLRPLAVRPVAAVRLMAVRQVW